MIGPPMPAAGFLYAREYDCIGRPPVRGGIAEVTVMAILFVALALAVALLVALIVFAIRNRRLFDSSRADATAKMADDLFKQMSR